MKTPSAQKSRDGEILNILDDASLKMRYLLT